MSAYNKSKDSDIQVFSIDDWRLRYDALGEVPAVGSMVYFTAHPRDYISETGIYLFGAARSGPDPTFDGDRVSYTHPRWIVVPFGRGFPLFLSRGSHHGRQLPYPGLDRFARETPLALKVAGLNRNGRAGRAFPIWGRDAPPG